MLSVKWLACQWHYANMNKNKCTNHCSYPGGRILSQIKPLREGTSVLTTVGLQQGRVGEWKREDWQFWYLRLMNCLRGILQMVAAYQESAGGVCDRGQDLRGIGDASRLTAFLDFFLVDLAFLGLSTTE